MADKRLVISSLTFASILRVFFRHGRGGVLIAVATACLVAGPTWQSPLRAQDDAAEDSAVEEAESKYTEDELKQIQLADRFLSVLEKNPRRGTAMDRVYGHHIEFGTLDPFIEKLKQRTADTPDEGAVWMVLGLFESQRGQDADAAKAFAKAEELRADDALAPYYMSQSLLRIGENDEGVAAMERAIERQPPRADLLEIFQQLGRVHQRAQRTEEAMAVWKRLEELFPGDTRVLEQIAVTLSDEGAFEEALPRYEKLAEAERDDYRKTMYRVAAAELKIKLQQRSLGIADLESILAELNPEGWLFRDVRRRIEDVFLRTNDQDSLVQYYEGWIASHPEDVEAMARLARFLSSSARVPEATQWMEKALKLAPTRSDLRKAFIDQLVEQQRFREAAEQYRGLCEAEPNNVDFLRDWGKLVLRDREVDMDARRAEAGRIWNLILSDRPNDAVVTAQVADLCRTAQMKERAFELYRKAVELAPTEPQYREYLGEFYFIEKQTDKALETWAGIAAAANRNAENLARAAEVYNSFGFIPQAVESIAAAVELEPKELPLLLRAADYHSRAEKFEDALEYVDSAEKLASNEEQRASVVDQRIDVLQSSGKLDEAIDELRAQIAAAQPPTVEGWQLLARYLQVSRDWPEATQAIASALEIDPQSLPALTTAASISEQAGNLGEAAEYHRRLAETDRRARGDHLMNVARLEAQLGRADEAMEAANQLIIAAPGNTDNYEFFAQLCFRLGRRDEGLDALRKAVRINPNEPRLTLALGGALAEDLQTREAIELYWRAFEKTEEVEDMTSLMTKLTPLYEQLNQFDQLVERLERDRREEDKRRAMTICLAQAYQTASDFGTARYELESLLGENTRDTNLLQQLAKLCQASGDAESAINYQRQLVALAPGHETEYPLATMLQDFGYRDEANEILVRLTRREEDPIRLLRSIDSLLTRNGQEAALEIIEPMLSQQRDDWELLYREIVALALMDKNEEAANRSQRLLAIKQPHDALSRSAEARYKQAQQKARSDNLRGNVTSMPTRESPLMAMRYASQVQQATGMMSDPYGGYGGMGGSSSLWTPSSFALARMGAYAWLLKFEQEQMFGESTDGDEAVGDEASRSEVASEANELSEDDAAADDELSDEDLPDEDLPDDDLLEEEGPKSKIAASLAEEMEREGAPIEVLYDNMYVASLLSDMSSVFDVARELARRGGDEEKRFFLQQMPARHSELNQRVVRSSNANAAPQLDPLSDEDLDLMLEIYNELKAKSSEDDDVAAASGGQIAYASDGQAYLNVGGQWIPIGYRAIGNYQTQLVINELRQAGRTELADQMFEEQLAAAENANQLAASMGILLEKKDFERLDEFYQRWLTQAREELAKDPPVASGAQARGQSSLPVSTAVDTLCRWMGHLGAQEEYDRVRNIGNTLLDLAHAEHRRTLEMQAKSQSRARRARSTQSAMTEMSTQVYFGDKQEYERMQYIAPAKLTSNTAARLLFQLKRIFREGDLIDEFVNDLRKRVSEADPAERPLEQGLLATMFWSNSAEDEALELLSELGGESADADFRLQLASLQLQRNQFDTALELVDSIAVVDQGVLRQRELMALQVAERLGDTDRARLAAERLFGMRLDSQTQLQLIDPMRRLGLRDLADAILARAQRSSTNNQPATLVTLMSLYRGQGKTQEAQKLAFSLLGRTVSPITSLVSSNQSPRYARSSSNAGDAAARTQALRLLKETGELDSMIADLEERIERFPDVMRSYELLVEYYEAAGEREKSLELLKRTVELQPQAYSLRIKLAETYTAQQKHSEACDQYLKILEDRPAWILEDFYRYTNVFRRAKRSEDVVKVLAKMDLRQVRQPWAIGNVVSQMMSEDPESEATILLLEKAVKQLPSHRSDLLRNIRGDGAYQNERIFKLVLKGIVPTRLEMRTNPWAGLDNVYSYSSTGTISTQFGQLLDNVSDPERLAKVQELLRKSIEQNPQWAGGKLMLALVGLKSGNDREGAKQVLTEFSSDEALLESMPYATCWLLGQELEAFEDQRELSVKMLEMAMTKGEADGSLRSQLQYSPMVKLMANYRREGRNAEAKETLMRIMSTSSFDNYDAAYANSQRVEQSMWSAGQLTELGYPATAIQLYQRTLADRNALISAGSWRGADDQYYLNQAKRGLATALKKIGSENFEQVLDELFTVEGDAKPGKDAFELLLSFPPASDLGSKKIDSPLMDLIATLSAEPAAADALNKRLEQLHRDHPEDLSLLVLAVRARAVRGLGTEDRDAVLPLLEDALAWAERHPLDEIAANRRPNSRQRKEAERQLPLWLIAQPTLGTPLWETHGRLLADRAIAAASRQLSDEQSIAMLFEWADGAVNVDRAAAEEVWNRLAALASKRPTVAGAGTDAAANAGNKRVPPLTQSQFEVAMQIAKRTAQLGMADISLNIVSDALAGGLPVPDANAAGGLSTTISSMGGVRVPISTRTATASNQSASVAVALNEVVRAWHGSEFEAERVYETLKSIVFPEEQPTQLRMMANSSALYNMQAASLGLLLVQWGKRSDKLSQLNELLKEREAGEDPSTRVSAEVMRTHIAIESNSYDDATSSLKKLEELAKQGMARDDLQLSLHAGIPAASKSELKDPAMNLLAAVLSQLKQPQPSSSDPFAAADPFGQGSAVASGGRLQAAVNKYLASKGSLDSLAGMFEERLARSQSEYVNYSGDYAVYRQWMELAAIANEAASMGAPKLAMLYLGRMADMEVERYGRPPTELALATTVDMTRRMEADERYRTWAEWTLPKEDRRTLRFVVEWIGGVSVPDEFATIPPEKRLPSGLMLSNIAELVDAARESGKLNELREQAEQAAEAKMLGAEHLLALTLIAMAGDAEPVREKAEEYLEGFFSRQQPTTSERSSYQQSSLSLADYQVYLAALKNQLYFDRAGEHFAPFDVRLRSGQSSSYRSMARRSYINHVLEIDGQAPLKSLDGWKNWVPFRQAVPTNTSFETWWLGGENAATHISGSGAELLAFAYPLVGDFEFTIDCYNGDWGECDVGYGGVIPQAQRWGSQLTVMTTSGHESLPRSQALKTTQPSYGEYRIVSKQGTMTVYLNGYKVYEETLSDTSPWLMLSTEGTRTSRFMNPRISGTPTIPRAVNLLSGERMDGWSTSAFSQSQPRQRTMAETVTDENSYLSYQQRSEPTEFTWETKDGVLRGAQSESYSEEPAWIFYQRPLRDGETFEYEFFYQPGGATAAPTLGQLAMLLEPNGVESHWISSRPVEEQFTGVKPDNKRVEKDYQTSTELPLKPGEWNKVTMQLLDGSVHLSVNDAKVFQRPTSGLADRRFGLFHYTNTRVEVRNATLRGDWPETVDEAVREGWFQWEREFAPQQLAVVSELLPRELDQPLMRQMVMQSREMSDDEAFEFLKQWVFPKQYDPRIRMGFVYLPLDKQKELDAATAPLDSVLSPALELVRTAQRLGQQNELLKQIDALNPKTAVDQHNQRALRVLAMLQDAESDCSEELAASYRGLEKAWPKSRTPMERSADFLVAVEAGRSARYWTAGYDLAMRLQAHERNGETSSGNGDWQSSVHSLVGSIALRWSGSPPANSTANTDATGHAGGAAGASQWVSVPYLKPQWRQGGERNSAWWVDRGAMTHVPGQHWSQLFFQSPLRGKYEITARRSTHGYKEVSIATGMHAVDPKHDLQSIRITKVMHNQEEKPMSAKLPVWDQSADFRIVVDDNSVTTHVNGVQLHRQPFKTPRDPWLVLQADAPGTYASVRDLRITGNPTIPDEIDLIDIDGWASWRFDMYGDWSTQEIKTEVPYNRIGDEIVGNVRSDRSAGPMESLMMYARPLLEDGEIEFETFYNQGEFEVHPTVGRTALMLDQERLTVHRLTDAQWQRGDLRVDNRQAVPEANAPLGMKAGEWNHVLLKLAGDKLTLLVNEQLVGEVTISEPRNERFFGLFRYSDLTGCRVRNLKYRGQWPKTLPPVDEQYAAYPPTGPYALEGLDSTTRYDLAGSAADLEKQGVKLLGQPDQVSTTANGLVLKLESGGSWERWPGASVAHSLQGDCEITVSYRDLAIQAGESGWGACLALQVALDDPQESTVEVSVRKNGADEPKTQGSLRRKMPDGQPSSLDLDAITGHNASGRLRLVRQGGRMHCLVADGDGETFRLIHSLTVGTAAIRQIGVQGKSSDAAGKVDVVVSDLIVRE